MRQGARQGVWSALIGVFTAIIEAIIQFLMIYWVLQAYGTSFSGFMRLTMTLVLIGGSVEGALGISTIVLLAKPLADGDWIAANEIISTTIKRYRRGLVSAVVLVTLIAIIYPLQIALWPKILGAQDKIVWGLEVYDPRSSKLILITIWELIGIVLIFGVKQIFSSHIFGIYDNIVMADFQTTIQKIVILFTDVLVYGLFLLILSQDLNGQHFLHPIIPFSILLAYAPIRGMMLKLYVRRYYPWMKFYPDFTYYPLIRTSQKMSRANLGQIALINSDQFLLFIVLGVSGLTVNSMLSLYILVGVNLRLILTHLITAFRGYFISLMDQNGRLTWESYSKYELYTFIVAAFAFIFMSIFAPYLVTGLYGNLIWQDLQDHVATSNPLIRDAQWVAFDFIFTKPLFSILYGATVAFILIYQGQIILIQAKGRYADVAKGINITAAIYLIVQLVVDLTLSIYLRVTEQRVDFLKETIMAFYIIKLSFMTFVYVYLWAYSWKYITYNSTFRYIVSDLLCLVAPIAGAILINLFLVSKEYPLTISISQPPPVISIGLIVSILVIVIICGVVACFVVPLLLRPTVAASLILSLPIVKRMRLTKKERGKNLRYRAANIREEDFFNDQKAILARALYRSDNRQHWAATPPPKGYVEVPKIYRLRTPKPPKELLDSDDEDE